MGFLSGIYNVIANAIRSFIGWVKALICSILSFVKDVVDYFKGLILQKGRDVPFLAQGQEFKDMIKNARVEDVGIFNSPNTVVEGVYNEQTDEIENIRAVGANELDEKTKSILKNDPIVVLN